MSSFTCARTLYNCFPIFFLGKNPLSWWESIKNNKTYCRGSLARAAVYCCCLALLSHTLCNFSCALLSGAQSPDWCTTCKHQFSSLLFPRERERKTLHTHFVCMWEALLLGSMHVYFIVSQSTHILLLCVSWKSIVSGAFPFVYIARFSGHKTLENSSGGQREPTLFFCCHSSRSGTLRLIKTDAGSIW